MGLVPPTPGKFPANCLIIGLMLLANLTIITSNPCSGGHMPNIRERRSYDLAKIPKDRSDSGNAVKMSSINRSTIFATENSTVCVAQIGGTATLPCIVKKFSTGVVSWIRKQESPMLLTVGLNTYSADDRILVEHVRHLQNWGLHIKKVQPSDAGLYECQVSTHPPTSIFIELKVTEASAEIVGGPDLHLNAGSQLRLVCTLKHSTEMPAYVFWYHEERMINYDPGVEVVDEQSSSVLQLPEADKSHGGNYTCSPSNAIPASINVHVLNSTDEEKPAAMLHANAAVASQQGLFEPVCFVLLMCNLVYFIVER